MRENLKVNEVDISVICTNIFDNAIDVTEQCSVNNRIIDFQICYDVFLESVIKIQQ